MDRRPAMHCRRPGCRCTHDAPCEFGWIENEPRFHNGHTQPYVSARPCPICRAETSFALSEREGLQA